MADFGNMNRKRSSNSIIFPQCLQIGQVRPESNCPCGRWPVAVGLDFKLTFMPSSATCHTKIAAFHATGLRKSERIIIFSRIMLAFFRTTLIISLGVLPNVQVDNKPARCDRKTYRPTNLRDQEVPEI